MAVGTGFVVGYLTSNIIIFYNPLINGLIGAVLAFIIYQYVSRSILGARRGELEHEYRIDLVEKAVKKMVLRKLGIFPFIKYFQDQFNTIRTVQKDICRNLLADTEIAHDNDSLYYIYYKLADLELREDNFEKEKRMLASAHAIRPNDLLANYRLALNCEMDGLVDDAINHYKMALNDPDLDSDALRKYIDSQVERIKTKGPKNRVKALGARYQAW